MENLINVDYNESFNVTTITLNRPEKRNALSAQMIQQLQQAIDQLHNDPHTKLVIIKGAGEVFCAGGDLSEFHGDLTQPEALTMLEPMKSVLWKLTTLSVPTVAWMNGLARGGGMELASACDFRFVQSGSNYGFTQGQLGISTGWGGGTLLYERIHKQDAYYWLVTADVREADQLIANRFAQGVFSNHDDIWESELMKPFLNRDIEQLKHWKQQWLQQFDLQMLKTRMDDEVKSCSYLWVSEAHHQAVAQFFNRK
ncbi:enoyl-CoA hydratase/isomerase family protein [Alkalibacillus almallahensis]|uniref:enoyl-CoA hydratase/isomerase family protein n=1 Tax=Alkalibacillus almallahensis TaxID=1379154 RepID=UPI001423FCF4|nr:enoyl-CoA hydratase/isomerase family protein [Alkalibacillus almallahensis]NIK10685.1 enoyl-CoA hydratase/carnithine racemase [Alkalibacillus almallahensis]